MLWATSTSWRKAGHSLLARNWRAVAWLSGAIACHGFREPGSRRPLQRPRRLPVKPPLEFDDREQLEPAATHEPELRRDVRVEVVPAHPERLRSFLGTKGEPWRLTCARAGELDARHVLRVGFLHPL